MILWYYTAWRVQNNCSSLPAGIPASSLVHLIPPCPSTVHPADVSWVLSLPWWKLFSDFPLHLGYYPDAFLGFWICIPEPCQLFHLISYLFSHSHCVLDTIVSFLESLSHQAWLNPWALGKLFLNFSPYSWVVELIVPLTTILCILFVYLFVFLASLPHGI